MLIIKMLIIIFNQKYFVGGYSFGLVDRTGTKIQLGKSSGLLVVKRSGYSKVMILLFNYVL